MTFVLVVNDVFFPPGICLQLEEVNATQFKQIIKDYNNEFIDTYLSS